MKKFIFIFLLILTLFLILLPKNTLIPEKNFTAKILDREGNVLKEFYKDSIAKNIWVDLKDISPSVIKTTLFLEDRRFYKHIGIDPIGIFRALYLNLKKGKIVSGGSTITQQVAKIRFSFKKRNIFHKIIEAIFALLIEAKFKKDEILEIYLNYRFYGNSLYGIEAAAQTYLHKSANSLSLAEAAFLANISRAPSLLNPYKNFKRAKEEQEKLLKRMLEKNKITNSEYNLALKQQIKIFPKENNFFAPHFCDYVLNNLKEKKYKISFIKTTLSLSLQKQIEKLLKNHIEKLKKYNVTNGAVVVIENKNSEILAMVGSVNYFDKNSGQVNGAISLRQPGSTLKPFTYALAIERGIPASAIIPDLRFSLPTPNGNFTPKNYDRNYHGPVRMRTALACSYNIPAVRILEEIGGTSLLLETLRKAGFKSLKRPVNYYGVGLTLGGGEVTLLELVRGYSIFARGGILKKEKFALSIKDKRNRELKLEEEETKKIFSPAVSYITTHILSDRGERIGAFGEFSPLNLPFTCAVKTGTSKDYRDNWTIGFTKNFTVGVWVGNFNGKPMHNISGITGAAPLFRDIMLILNKKYEIGKFEEPDGIVKIKVCARSGKLPSEKCPNLIEEIYISGTQPKEICSIHCIPNYEIYPPIYYQWIEDKKIPYPLNISFKNKYSEKRLTIIFPKNGEIFKIDPEIPLEYQNIFLKAIVPERVNYVNWIVDGKEYEKVGFPFTFSFRLIPGKHKFQVSANIDNKILVSKPVEINVLN